MKISDLYEVDNLDVCRNSFYKGFHVWHAIRYMVLNEVFMQMKNVQEARLAQKKDLGTVSRFIYQSIKNRPPKRQFDIVFFTSTVGNMDSDGVFVNRLCDYFYGQFPEKSLILEDAYFLAYRRPRAAPVSYTGWFSLWTRATSMLYPKGDASCRHIGRIIQDIKKIFPVELSDAFWEDVSSHAFRQYRSFLIKKKIYLKYFRKVKPRIIFQNCASYGWEQALAVTCKTLGIVYAELQHGFVGREHIAYNYGSSFFSESTRYLLPSVFMMFGKYWEEQITHPAHKILVGFPFLELQAKEKESVAGKRILLVSDGDNPRQNRVIIDWLQDFAIRHEYKIILKLHPVEHLRKDEWYGDLLTNDLMEIKAFEPVYPLICNSEIVIGGASTVMFEALCFGKSPLVFRNERVLGDGNFCQIFDTFDTKDELLQLVERQGGVVADKSYFFDNGWEHGYSNYVSALLAHQAK